MSDIREFRSKILTETLRQVDEPLPNWRTYNDKINSTVFLNDVAVKRQVKLATDELPLFECALERSYVLITTERVIAVNDGQEKELLISNIQHFGNEFEKQNFAIEHNRGPKTNKVSLYDSEANNLVFTVDSLNPAYFSKILIMNLIKNSRGPAST